MRRLTHTAEMGQTCLSWLPAVLVTLYHIASFSNCWQEAPEMGVLREGARVLASQEVLFGMCEVVGVSVLGESSGSRGRGQVWRSSQGQWRGR